MDLDTGRETLQKAVLEGVALRAAGFNNVDLEVAIGRAARNRAGPGADVEAGIMCPVEATLNRRIVFGLGQAAPDVVVGGADIGGYLGDCGTPNHEGTEGDGNFGQFHL